MKAYDFVQALNDVNDKYVNEAVTYKKPATSLKIWRAVAIAACVCLAGTLALTLANMNATHSDYTANGVMKQAAAADEALYFENTIEMPANRQEETFAAAEMARESIWEEEAEYEVADYDMAIASTEEEQAVPAPVPASASVAGDAVAAEEGTAADSKIIYNVYMEMETTDFDNVLTQLNDAVASAGGYCENQNISNNSRSYRNANVTARIPAENLNSFVDRLGEVCTVTYISRSADDISESYYDIESRLNTAKTKLARLQELLEEAENMEDIINIESAISDVQWEIDSYSGSLQYYDSRISYSTVTVYVNEVYEVIVDDAPQSFGERIAKAFTTGIRDFGNFLKDVVVWIANSWLWLILVAVIVVVVIVIICKAARRRK